VSEHPDEVLISVAQRFVEAYRLGYKAVEVRRRPLNVLPQTRIWIYGKLPLGRVELVGRVDRTVVASPSSIWKRFGNLTSLTRKEFFEYCEGCNSACAILIGDLKELAKKPTLSHLREGNRAFQPPQFAKFLKRDDHVYRILAAGELGVSD
jgi:predicted transcriptional regulator